MATTKKSATKTKKVAPKRKAATKTRASRASRKSREMRSLRVSRPNKPFMTFAFTEQTAYWLIILALVTGIVMYVINTGDRINAIYDQVDSNTAQLDMLPDEVKQAKKSAHTE